MLLQTPQWTDNEAPLRGSTLICRLLAPAWRRLPGVRQVQCAVRAAVAKQQCDHCLTAAVSRWLKVLAHAVVGLAEIGAYQAGVGPGGRVPRELGEELNAALYEQRAGLLQPPALAVVAHVAHGMQQEVSHLGICRAGWVRDC